MCNNSLLTTTLSLGCRDAKAGITSIFVTEFFNLVKTGSTVGYTVDSNDIITGITLTATKKFFEIKFHKDLSSYVETETQSLENGNVTYAGVLNVILHKIETSKRTFLKSLRGKDLAIIIKYADDTYWAVGFGRGAMLATNEASTGAVFTDRNGYNLTFNSSEYEPAYPVSSTLINSSLITFAS